MWNIFRLAADLLHLASFFILILKIRRSKNCNGLSCKTQILLLVVFCSRYLDLFYSFSHQNAYLIIMKILFISATVYTIFLMRFQKPYCESYDASVDNFRHWLFLMLGAFVAAIFVHRGATFTDMIWSFSIWLEAIAILPQLHMLIQLQEIENITAHYVAALGLYRFLYIFNCLEDTFLRNYFHFALRIYRYYSEDYICWTSVSGGILQTFMFADFLYYYVKSVGSSHVTYGPTPQVEVEIGKIESNNENDITMDPASQYQSV